MFNGYDTSAAISQLQDTANQLKSAVKEQAEKVDVALDKIDKTVKNVADKIAALRKMIVEGEEKNIAHENLLRLDKQINEQLEYYRQTRLSVLGFIKDFDINLVRQSTATSLSEELWMSASRYWLSYVFLALTAWTNDNREVCTTAIEEAMRVDANKTSLFFCLLNLRLKRNAYAREWLYEYFGAVDSMHPPRETALILRAYLYGVFGRDSQLDGFVRSTVERWVTELNTDSQISTQLVEGFNHYLVNLPAEKSGFSSDLLDECCATVGEMQNSLADASRYKVMRQRLARFDAVEENPCGGDFIRKVDALLEDLVNNYDEEELRLNNEKKFYQFIMEHQGNVEAAKKAYAAYMKDHGEEPNIGQQMFRWAVYPDEGIDLSIQKFAVQKTKGWYMDSVKTYDHAVKSSAPSAFKLHIDLWEDTTDGKDREAVKQGLRSKYEEEKSRLLIFTKGNIAVSVVAVVLLILGVVIGVIASETSWGFIGFIVGPVAFAALALVVVLKTLISLKAYPKRIQRAENTLEACLDAIDSYRAAFDEACAVKDEVLKILEFI